MGVYKRGATYWIDINVPGFARIRRSAGTEKREEAQELHDRLKADLWRTSRLEEKPKRSWQEAVVKYLKDSNLKDEVTTKQRLKWLHQYLGDKMLDQLTRDYIESIGEIKRKESSNSTANRYLEIIRAILNLAMKRWEWVDRVPFVRLYKEPSIRVRWLTRTEAVRLLDALPLHLKPIVIVALNTGLREQNILRLKWSEVDLSRKTAWVHADEVKNQRSLAVPLNADTIDAIRGEIGKNAEYVFTYKGNRLMLANSTAWKNALKRAGIEDFRFHDLRHTWASWHVQAGTPLHVLQELGGWQSIEMVRRYAHLGGQQLQGYADSVNLGLGTNMTQRVFSIVGK